MVYVPLKSIYTIGNPITHLYTNNLRKTIIKSKKQTIIVLHNNYDDGYDKETLLPDKCSLKLLL